MHQDFKRMRQMAGFNSREKVAEFCGVTVKTVKNWEKHGAPTMTVKLMGLMAGDLSHLGKAWRGIYLEPDCIAMSKIDFIYPCEIPAIRFVYNKAGIDRSQLFERDRRPFELKENLFKTPDFTDNNQGSEK